MDIDTLKSSPSGRLVQAVAGKDTYWAFVPNPLPPKITYSAQLRQSLSEADRALGELAGQGRLMANPHLLIHRIDH